MVTIRYMARQVFGLMAISLVAIALSSAQSSAQSPTQSWPQRPVKLLLTLGPGSGADISARLIGEKLAAIWNQPVVVENRPGGDGFVAITAFVGSRDDHTLLFGPASSFTAHPYLHAKLPYDPRDLAPVARVSATLLIIGAPPSLNVNSLADLLAMVRAQPGKMNWATVTGATDLVVASYLKSENLDMAKIPYRDPVQALNDAAEGRLHLYWSALAIVRGAIEAGRIKPLAFPSSQRAKTLPNVPTVTEAGFPGLAFDGLVGIYGARDMPDDVRERIAADVKTVLSDPAMVNRLEATGQVVVPGSAKEFAADIAKQQAGVANRAKVLGIAEAR